MRDSVKVLAVREYGVVMPAGAIAKLSFAMCDPRDEDSSPVRFARLQGAHACGLITIMGVQGAPATPILWIAVNDQIAVTVGDSEPDLTPALRDLIQRHMEEYFRDIADLVPELVGFGLKPRTLH
jgi:hypothetical protein